MKRILVLGMGRSGTSFITEFLKLCGVYLGEVSTKSEHILARLINESVLSNNYGAKKGLPYGHLPDEEIILSENWHQLASIYVDYMDMKCLKRKKDYWAVKDPRMTILHDIWLKHFDILIGVFRSPSEVIDSYLGKKWIGGFRKKKTVLNYWKRFNKSLLYIYSRWRHKKNMYILDYNCDMNLQTEILCKNLNIKIPSHAKNLYSRALKHYKRNKLPDDEETIRIYGTLNKIKLLKND